MEREEVKNHIVEILCDMFYCEEDEIDESDSLRDTHGMSALEAEQINNAISDKFGVNILLCDTLSGREIVSVGNLIDTVYEAINGGSIEDGEEYEEDIDFSADESEEED